MKGFGKRFFSVFLALVMVLGLMPTSALAADYNVTNGIGVTYEVGDTYTGDSAPSAPTGTKWVDTEETGVGCAYVNVDVNHTAHTEDCYTDVVVCTKSIAFLNHSAACILLPLTAMAVLL